MPPDERERRPGGNLEREALEDRPLVAVREADVVEADVGSIRERAGRRRFDDDRLGLEHVDDAACGRDRALHRADPLPDRAQRVDEQHEVEGEEGERADRDLAGEHPVGAVPEHDEDADQRQRLERGQEHRVDAGDLERRLHDLVRLAAEAVGERLARAEALDHPDPGDRLLDECGQFPESFLVHLRALRVAPRVAAEADAEQRERREDGEGERPVDHQQHHSRREHGEDVADRVADRVEEPRHELGVVRRA